MTTMLIWFLGLSLEILLLVRGLQKKLVPQYPIFYSYLSFILAQDVLRIAVFKWSPSHYLAVYWTTELFGLLLGSTVIFEVYRVALRGFPGTAKMASRLLLLLFGVVSAKAVATPFIGFYSWFAHTFESLEWQLRLVQALALLALAALFLWYAIPFGRNLRGILLGYATFVVLSVLQFSMLASFWSQLRLYWPYVQPITYLLILSFWTWSLWSAYPVPVFGGGIQMEYDYESLVEYTHRQLQKLRSRMHWTAIP